MADTLFKFKTSNGQHKDTLPQNKPLDNDLVSSLEEKEKSKQNYKKTLEILTESYPDIYLELKNKSVKELQDIEFKLKWLAR